jgi:hypothetical protein
LGPFRSKRYVSVKSGDLASSDIFQLNNRPDISEMGLQASKFRKTPEVGIVTRLIMVAAPVFVFKCEH